MLDYAWPPAPAVAILQWDGLPCRLIFFEFVKDPQTKQGSLGSPWRTLDGKGLLHTVNQTSGDGARTGQGVRKTARCSTFSSIGLAC